MVGKWFLLVWAVSDAKSLTTVFYQVYFALFYIENDAEIFPGHYTWKLAE